MRGHLKFQMHSSPVPIVLFHPSIHLLPSHHTGRNPPSANSASTAEDQHPLPSAHHHERAPAHQHDISHFELGPAPDLKLIIPNLSISSSSLAHGSSVHGCDCFLLAKDLGTSLSTQQQRVRQSCGQRGRAPHNLMAQFSWSCVGLW